MRRRSVLVAALVCLAGSICLPALAATAKQQFTITSTSSGNHDGPTRVTASGAVAGRGTVDVRSSKDSRVDHMTLHLARGDIFLVAVEKTYAVRPNPAQCLADAVGRGTFQITGGTGDFASIRGLGTYLRHGVLYGSRNASGACLGQKGPITKTTLRVVMTGSVKLG